MSSANNKTSVIIEQQIPEFVREEYPTFVAFLKSYYEYMELADPPTELPLIPEVPDLNLYSPSSSSANVDNLLAVGKKVYGTSAGSNTYIPGELIVQKANPDDPTEITASAKIFSFNGTASSQTAVVTSFGGTQKRFIKGYEIVGQESGVAYWPALPVVSMPAGAERARMDLSGYKDIDDTLDDYVQYIKNEVAINLPGSLNANTDTRTALKNIRDFYRARGTENSFKLLFRLLYGEDAEVYLPQEDMLYASTGEWQDITIIRTTVPTQDYATQIPVATADLIGRKIIQPYSGATAIVESALNREYLNIGFAELQLSSVTGTFLPEYEIKTESIGDGTDIRVEPIGMLTEVNISDGGSNYEVGDRIEISGGGSQRFLDDSIKAARGAVAKVATTNASSGAVLSVEIVEPGLFYTEVPTVALDGPHQGDAGSARFESGKLETIFYDDFSTYSDANSFLSVTDNRGPFSNIGQTGNDVYGGVMNSWSKGPRWPYHTDTQNPGRYTNTYFRFTPIPGRERGLKGWWRMNQYSPFDVRINSKDGHDFGDSLPYGPSANSFYRGPRVGDVLYVADRRQPGIHENVNNYVNETYNDVDTVNTYFEHGWRGFQPVVLDESGNDLHARVRLNQQGQTGIGPRYTLASRPTSNLFSEHAFANSGIYGTSNGTSNSFGMHGTVSGGATYDGGLVLATHDDIRNANQQSWIFWVKPHKAPVDDDIGTYSSGDPIISGPRIISRGASHYWSLIANTYSAADSGNKSTGEYINVSWAFPGAFFDNGQAVGAGTSGSDEENYSHRIANNSGYYPGSVTGEAKHADSGVLRVGKWNMVALTIDYTAGAAANPTKGVANLYFFNVNDGLLVTNGISTAVRGDSNTVQATAYTYGWPQNGYVFNDPSRVEGRAVVLGGQVKSANGDSYDSERSLGLAHLAGWQYDEVRYYDKKLSAEEIIRLFHNPSGEAQDALSGPWSIRSGYHYAQIQYPTQIEFVANSTIGNSHFGAVVTSPAKAASGGVELHIGGPGYTDALGLVHTKNIPYDPTHKYKFSVRARDMHDDQGTTAAFGAVFLANTGTHYLSYRGLGDASIQHDGDFGNIGGIALGRLSAGPNPDGSGSVGPGWFEYTGVLGGNTTYAGVTSANPGYGSGGNTQFDHVNVHFFDWNNPVRAPGASGTGMKHGNTGFIRPMMSMNNWGADKTAIDYFKIERVTDATLTSTVGAQIKLPGKFTGDKGKLSTSPNREWVAKYLQDNHYYQIYSYVIKSGFSLDTYQEVIKKLAHPAGSRMFGGVDIQSQASVAISTVSLADLQELILKFYLGSESALISEYADLPIAGRGVGYRTGFGLKNSPSDSFNLDYAHGTNPHGWGNNVPGSPGWVAWNQSPLTSPYANSHYRGDITSDALGIHGGDWDLYPYNTNAFPKSNAHTTVTKETLVWHINGFRSILGSAFSQPFGLPVGSPLVPITGGKIGGFELLPAGTGVGALWTHVTAKGYDHADSEAGFGQQGWTFTARIPREGEFDGKITDDYDSSEPSAAFNQLRGTSVNRLYHITSPLDIDGGQHRYVRMKIRRVGPGGYGADSWIGACQFDTNPSTLSSDYSPTLGLTPTQWNAGTTVPAAGVGDSYTPVSRTKFYGSANVAQPSTLMVPSTAPSGTKSPWHILEWDMWDVGEVSIVKSGGDAIVYPIEGGSAAWKWANSTTGSSPQDGGASGRRIGSINFQLCYEPDNADEKFEIEWIQVDDGTGWARGSYPIPSGYTLNASSAAAGSGGIVGRQRVVETSDFTEQTIGDFSAAVTATAPSAGEVFNPAPVIYTHSDKINYAINDSTHDNIDDWTNANGAIFRVSANTANNRDWTVTEIIDSETFLKNAPKQDFAGQYVGGTVAYPSANGKFTGPVILDTDPYDNLFVGYLYQTHGTYPDTAEDNTISSTEPKPLLLFRLTPIANAQPTIALPADPHNLYSVGNTNPVRGRSNNYAVEQILWGNTGGDDNIGIMVGGDEFWVNDSEQDRGEYYGSLTTSMVDFSTDDLGSLYVVGTGSMNLIKIMPAANGSYANGVTSVPTDTAILEGRKVYELANSTSYDANGCQLGIWRPQHVISGPKDSLFVACDTGYDPDNRGANSVYLYHVVQGQDIATKDFYTQNIHPVYANTRGIEDQVNPVGNDLVPAGLQHRITGMATDNHEPPNLWFTTANNLYRVQPKGYSYELGDATIDQIFPDNYHINTLKAYPSGDGARSPGWIGSYLDRRRMTAGSGRFQYMQNYLNLEVDSRNRVYFGGFANLFMYTHVEGSSGIAYNQESTTQSSLIVVANTNMYTANIDWDFSSTGTGSTINVTIGDFAVLENLSGNSAYQKPESFDGGVIFTLVGADDTLTEDHTGADNHFNANNTAKQLCVIYPNQSGSFLNDNLTASQTGQHTITIMDDNPAAETKFWNDGTGHDRVNKYQGRGPGRVALRPQKK